jgi:hypothetical protein
VTARAIIGGDATSPAISAASILAKTARDAYMNQMDTIYPQYAFAAHKGYCTPEHQRLLALHGPCPLHRQTFAPVRESRPGLTLPRPDDSESLAAGGRVGSLQATAPPVACRLPTPPPAVVVHRHRAEEPVATGLEGPR